MADDDFIWLQNPAIAADTGPETGKAQFSAEAAPIWRKRGWVDCDPPVVLNIWRDDVPPEPEPAAEPMPESAATRPVVDVQLPAGDIPPPPATAPDRRPAGNTAEEASK